MMNSNNLIFSLDIGTRSIKGAVLENDNGKLKVLAEEYLEHEERAMHDGQIHNIPAVARTVLQVKTNLENKLDIKLENVAIAAAGRFLRTLVVNFEEELSEEIEIDKDFIRALELSAIKKAELEINNSLNAESANTPSEPQSSNEDINAIKSNTKLYCVGHTIKNYFLNGYTISSLLSHRGKVAGVELIATFLPSSVVDSLYAVMKMVNLSISTLTLEPIAAMEAIIPPNLRLLNLALVDIGAGTSDIAISNKDCITGYGMVPLAGDEVTEVVSQNYLLDFKGAEELKKKFSANEDLTYKDILGFDYTTNTEDMEKILDPVVENISSEISKEILNLNGDKSPSAIFLVGGGAHTPMLLDKIASKLDLPKQRIAIKGREAIANCSFEDFSLGSIGVTVIGIGLIAANKTFENYIEVSLNNSPVTLFNLNNVKICDVLVQASINPKLLIGRPGEDVSFTINGATHKALGNPPIMAKVYINDKEASLDTLVNEGDDINIVYAKNGSNASPKIYEYLSSLYDNINFKVNDNSYTIEPEIYINDIPARIESCIESGDNVTIILNTTLKSFCENHIDTFKGSTFYMNNVPLEDNYSIKSGDNIYTYSLENMENNMSPKITAAPTESIKSGELVKIDIPLINKENINKNPNEIAIDKNIENLSNISVLVNNKPVQLTGKKDYIFIDIFDFINFDRNNPKGILILKHNGESASYFSKLCNGDTIDISWK